MVSRQNVLDRHVGHGVVLLIGLLIVDLILALILSVIPVPVAAIVIRFIVGALIEGLLAKEVASIWEKEEGEEEEET